VTRPVQADIGGGPVEGVPGLSRPGPDIGGGPDEQLPGKSRRGADVRGGPDERVPGHLHQGAHSTPHGLHSRQKYVKKTPIRRRT
jgi:hypothetical protein